MLKILKDLIFRFRDMLLQTEYLQDRLNWMNIGVPNLKNVLNRWEIMEDLENHVADSYLQRE